MTSDKFKDLSGLRFERLVVLKRSKRKGKRGETYWWCRCDCGTAKEILGTSLNHDRTKSCGCLGIEKRRQANSKDDKSVATNLLYLKYKDQAKRRNILFNLSQEEFKSLIFKNCYFCGEPPSNVFANYRKNNQAGHQPVLYNGIDRLDSDGDYEIDNCVTCCSVCNYGKRQMSEQQFLSWIAKVYRYQFKRVVELTPGQLIDNLGTVLVKCFMAQEDIMNAPEDSEEALSTAKKAQNLNAQRNKLIRSIDTLLGFEEDTPSEKTYQ